MQHKLVLTGFKKLQKAIKLGEEGKEWIWEELEEG